MERMRAKIKTLRKKKEIKTLRKKIREMETTAKRRMEVIRKQKRVIKQLMADNKLLLQELNETNKGMKLSRRWKNERKAIACG